MSDIPPYYHEWTCAHCKHKGVARFGIVKIQHESRCIESSPEECAHFKRTGKWPRRKPA